MGKVPFELLGFRTGNSLRASIALEESGLAYRATIVDLASGEHRGDAFRSLNPAGKVPVLIDRRDPDREMVLTQSNAIMLHLADTVPGLLTPVGDAAAAVRFRERFFYFITDVIAPNHGAFALRSGDTPAAVSFLSRISAANLEAAERFLDDGSFMAGDRFSLVDIAAFTIARSIGDGVDWASRPRLRDWFDRIAARPAVARGLTVFD